MKVLLMQALGYGFLLLGLLGLFLPILQGILFLVIGLLILSRYAPWAERLLHYAEDRYPKIAGMREEAENRAALVSRKVASWFRSS